ncbi:COP9 signalosome [Russula brevipes]|nr:COP9 signalosome [Russula brevipes]
MDVLTASEGHDPSSPYVELFAQIATLQAKGDHYGLIQAAERADLAVTHDNNPMRLLLTMPLVIASGKFALMRLPEAVASHPLARAMLSLFSSMWERRYEHVYSRGEALFNLAQQGHFSHTEVTEVLSASVTAFIDSFRQRTVVLLSNAYTTIPLALAQVYLGLSTDDLLSFASEKGWHFDPATHIMTPLRVARKICLPASAQSVHLPLEHR